LAEKNSMVKPKTSPRRRKRAVRSGLTKLLIRAGSSPVDVAELEGVSRSHVCKVIAGKRTSAKVQKRIEAILKKPWDKLVAEQS